MQRWDVDLGSRLVPFEEGWQLQRAVHAEVVAGTRPSTLLLMEHEAVYTVGRRAHSWERPQGSRVGPAQVPVVEVDRGGKTTWHGPGQLTVYPILRLAVPVDVIRYVRALEEAVMQVCTSLGMTTRQVEGRTGVWVPGDPQASAAVRREDRKICALGVRVARGVTMHGIGLNVSPDLEAFSLERILPCGITDAGVTSVSAETGRQLRAADLADAVSHALTSRLSPLVADPTSCPAPDVGTRSYLSAAEA
ncbi:lipoyl(octanoyl) transferase LipB [Actinomyces sp. 2119]|uniref:lipoyl(octanoyl) transferase LipB n=1 Tax=Actinomyces sp. 2119 TaxID=2321393 RepID=UPI000E6C41D9|nr:lipoyl(octanoyl) transferase LipB [Actinomyces sp. 2119]RJF44684.1 lipoyl(octanoyl) transferase LipB [Actinomyces sp. 2119]